MAITKAQIAASKIAIRGLLDSALINIKESRRNLRENNFMLAAGRARRAAESADMARSMAQRLAEVEAEDNPSTGGLGRGLAIAGVVAAVGVGLAALRARPLSADPFQVNVAGLGRCYPRGYKR